MSTGNQVDIHEELAGAAVTPLHKALGILITLITLFDGYDTFNPAYVIQYVKQPWGLSPSQAGFLVSSGLIGFLFGAMGHGMVADRYGRRNTLLAGLWIVNVLNLLPAIFATSYARFCGLRFLTGLGLGVLLPLGTTYINELAPQRVSNSFSLWGVTFGWSLGGVVAGLVGVFLTPTYGWQILYFAGTMSVSLTIWLTAFLTLFAIFGLTGWIPTVMIKRGETFAASFGFGALLQAMSFFGGLMLATLADRGFAATPRLLGTWWAIGGLAVGVLVFVNGHGFNIAVVAIAGFCVIGAQHVLNNFTANSYETGLRASGVGMELGVGRVGAILGPYVIGLLQQATGGPDAVFWAISGAAIVAAAVISSLAISGKTAQSSVAPAE